MKIQRDPVLMVVLVEVGVVGSVLTEKIED